MHALHTPNSRALACLQAALCDLLVVASHFTVHRPRTPPPPCRAQLLRVYDDGHVEFIRFVWAKFDMHESVEIGNGAGSERPGLIRSATAPPRPPFART